MNPQKSLEFPWNKTLTNSKKKKKKTTNTSLNTVLWTGKKKKIWEILKKTNLIEKWQSLDEDGQKYEYFIK